jgi:hypothetical protein
LEESGKSRILLLPEGSFYFFRKILFILVIFVILVVLFILKLVIFIFGLELFTWHDVPS